MADVPVISFVGSSGCGKTTYLEKLIAVLKGRGHRVGVIKHDAHGFEIDHPGKDTWRHAQAGADVVCIASPAKYAMIAKVEREPFLAELAARIDGVDVILTEGYKREGRVKIEVFRRAACVAPVCPAAELVAMVGDVEVYPGLPLVGLDDPEGMADFIETRYLGNEKGAG